MPRSPRRIWWVLLAAAIVGILAAMPIAGCSTAPAKYPNRPIEVIVPWAPGGGSDLAARFIAAYATKKFGQPVNVVNVAGASGVTGTMQMLAAKADGYTMQVDGTSNTSFLAATRTDLPFKLEDRTWIGQWTADPMYHVFNASVPFKDLKEAMAFAKEKPGEFTWSSGGQGGMAYFHGMSILDEAGIDPLKTKLVIYPEGMAPAVQACLAGTVMMVGGMSTDVEKLLPTGKIKVLGVAANQRTKAFPDVPSTKELGFPKSNLVSWYGVSGPKGLPKDVVDAWTKLAEDAAKDPEFAAEADKQKRVLSFLGAKEFEASVMKEYEQVKVLSEKLGIRK